ncbi:hypothetical protein [Plesiocystis pacifica]|uniref:hypothetical protein n=1 Tax=Plesiocystis pacifica TaxID=191768 RepID=UPI0005D46921|nr:hypothetical protein [Plesiocystis pacifica]
MTNTVKPKVEVESTTVWYDPQRVTPTPVKVTFSITQSEAPDYPGGATISIDRDDVALFLDDKQTKPLAMAENRAWISNAQLTAGSGFVAYVAGIEATDVTATSIALSPDPLESSEIKKTTNFRSNTKVDLYDVKEPKDAPGGKKQVTVKKGGVVAPTMSIGDLDTAVARVFSTAPFVPITFGLAETQNDAPSTYDGDGTLTLSPTDATVELYADAKGTNKVTITNGKATIPNLALRSGTTYYLGASSSPKAGAVELSLSLAPGSAPKQMFAHGEVRKPLLVAQVNTVTPVLTASYDPSLDDALWFPALAKPEPPSVVLKISQTQAKLSPYVGHAQLTRSSGALSLYRDAELTEPVDFFDNHVVLRNAALTGDDPLRLYMAGSAAGEVELSLSLYDPKHRSVAIAEPAKLSVPVKAVNVVTAEVEYQGPIVKTQLTEVKLFAAQGNAEDAAYGGKGTLTRGSLSLELFADEDGGEGRDPLFKSGESTAPLANRDLIDERKVYYATWTADEPPSNPIRLELELSAADEPYVVTEPQTELRQPALRNSPVTPVEASSVVTPVLDTEYDVLLMARSVQTKTDAVSPVRAKIGVKQSTPAVPYLEDGTLKRADAKLRVYLDADCSEELSFNPSNEAIIPNAWLVDTERVYYLQGAAPGKTSLTLSAGVPQAEFPAPPAISVGKAVTKALAVSMVELDIYRDDASSSPARSVKMSSYQKQTRGRCVPVQNEAAQFGRAKVVVKKVETSDWPSSAHAHRVLLAVLSDEDAIALYNADSDGDVVGSKGSAWSLDAQAAGKADNTAWAQGKAASAALNDVRLVIQIDRTDETSWTGTKPLTNGDWALVTSVAIQQVAPTGEDWRQYVNQPPKRDALVNDNGDALRNGRGILATATTQPAVAGIGVDLMLWGFDKNGDATDDEPRKPRIDKPLQASKAHVSAVSDTNGKASARLELSRYGGDNFYAVAFLSDDAIKGTAELGKKGDKAPASSRSKKIQVWRKLGYTLAVMKRWDTGDYSARANEDTFKGKYEDTFLELDRKGDVKVVDHQNILSSGVAVGTWWTNNSLPAPAERVFNLVLCDSLADDTRDVWRKIVSPSDTTATDLLDGAYDLSAKNKWLLSGLSKVVKKLDKTKVASIPDNKITLEYSGPSKYKLSADIAGLQGGLSLDELEVWVAVTVQKTYSGFSWGPKTFVAMRLREQKASDTYDATQSANHTMWHEAGHYLGLTAVQVPVPANTYNVYYYKGSDSSTRYNLFTPPPPTKVGQDTEGQKIGQGPHCRYSSTAWNPDSLKTNKWIALGVSPQCIMFHALSTPITINYCADCTAALRARDLSSPAVSGSSGF